MADMLDRLSRWAQVAFEAAPDKSERFALAVVLEELGNRWRALAAARGVGFEHSASESASTEIYADQDSVVQALDALLENALSATGEGGRIALCLEAVDDSVLVTVRDDGAGLTSDEIGHVFEPFWRGSQGGFGLGLAIAKHVATRHGGSLRATSEGPGLGAAFTLQLPAGLRGEAVTD
jgi:signal transduction histidine kinase